MNERDKQERRKYVRIAKQFIISYYALNDPEQQHDVSQLHNIGMGGMCFVASRQFPVGAAMGIELKTPYINETAHLEGTVLEAYEKIPNVVYETRMEFGTLNDTAQRVLAKIVETFVALPE